MPTLTHSSPSSAPNSAPNASTETALQDTVLTPRFYTTDFAAMDRIDVDAIRPQWEALMAEFGADNNTDHFQRPADMLGNYSEMPPCALQGVLGTSSSAPSLPSFPVACSTPRSRSA